MGGKLGLDHKLVKQLAKLLDLYQSHILSGGSIPTSPSFLASFLITYPVLASFLGSVTYALYR